jgi:hypothetical protein
MKRTLLLSSLLLIIAWIISCKKEYSCEGCLNKPPLALAGPDQILTLPTDSILLDGSSSNDPDGKITQWLWTKISGPASFIVVAKSSSKTRVRKLVAGVYQFELRITDNGGLSAKDTVMITVDPSPTINHPPLACAGTDQVITLPINTVTLDGSCSTDPDNNITSYSWSKISGPTAFSIVNANALQTPAKDLVEGMYLFELKVTDAAGAFDRDTIQITVNPQAPTLPACDNSNRPTVNAQLIPVGTLSLPRIFLDAASAGNKILFAGGYANSDHSSRVDILDLSTHTWSIAELCVRRDAMAAVAAGNKIFFAGGEYGDGTWPVDSVDIYDVPTNTWTVAHLSVAGNDIAGTTVGNKLFFAGGDGGFSGAGRERTVDIYDLSTNSWTVASLSDPKRGGLSALTAGAKVYIAGGETMIVPGNSWDNNWGASKKIDIYDNSAGTWSTSTMVEGKVAMGSIVVNDKIFWAGGITGNYPNIYNSCLVEIKDANTGNSTVQYLFKPQSNTAALKAVLKDNKIAFLRFGEDHFDIYDLATNNWSIGVLSQPIPFGAVAISVNNTIYIAGGAINGSNTPTNQVWKLEF